MKGIHFTIGLIGKSSLLPLCVMAPGCYACVYETQYRARHLGVERGAGNCRHTCCSCSVAYDVYGWGQSPKMWQLLVFVYVTLLQCKTHTNKRL